MTAPVAAAAGAVLIAAGLLTIGAAFRTPATMTGPRRIPLWRRVASLRHPRAQRRTGVLAAAVAGLLVWVLTGWAVAAVILPAGAAIVPSLLRIPDAKSAIKRLEAMEEWTRNLAGVLTVGVGLEQAIIASLRTTPEAIRPEVATLVSRLRVRWNTEQALRAFADDLNDPTGDRIASALIVGSRSRAQGLVTVLERLGETVADEVRTRRRIESDRAKQRASARYVTIIVLLTVVLLAAIGDYVAVYATPRGQLLLIAWLGLYLVCLWWMRQITAGKASPRFLGAAASPSRGGGGRRS
ncbi:MAG: type II secretion system F family protein [bacterium]